MRSCPRCGASGTDITEYGHVRGSHVFRCRKCRRWLEVESKMVELKRNDVLFSIAVGADIGALAVQAKK